MNTPNSHTRIAYVDHTVTIGDVTLDLYPAPHGPGWWTPADPIFRLSGIPDEDQMDFRRQHGMTNVRGGSEIVWDNMRPEHQKPIELLSPHAVDAVLVKGQSRGLSAMSAEAVGEIHFALRA